MKDLLDMKFVANDPEDTVCRMEKYPLAYAYVPYQTFETPYSKSESLKNGTIFPSLNKPLGVYGKEFCGKEEIKKLW